MISFVIVGSGYRSEYFGRIAHTYPNLFRALFLCRSAEKAEAVTRHTDIPSTVSIEECMAFHPDFVVIAVDRGHMAEQTALWAGRGLAVLAETPLGCTEQELCELWQLQRSGARISSCEQYCRTPILASGLREIQNGRIGEPHSLYISLLHDYHAASLIRLALRLKPGDSYTVTAERQKAPVTGTDSREGVLKGAPPASADRDMALISFANGTHAVYDFCPVQYRTFLYSRHLTVRGTRGEWSDTAITWLDDRDEPQRMILQGDIPDRYSCLDTQLLRDRRRNWLYALAPDTVQDEFAIATMLLDMKKYVDGGLPPYSIEDALEDAYFWLRLNEAVKTPGQVVASARMPWHG